MKVLTRVAEATGRNPLPGWRRRAVGAALDGRALAVKRTEPLRRRAHPVASVMSPASRVVAGLAVACLVGVFLLGWSELAVAAGFCSILLALCVAFVVGRHQLSARLDLSRDRVVVGERAHGRLVMVNRGTRRTLPLTVELPVGPSAAGFDLPSLAVDAEYEDLFAIPSLRRAVLTVGPVLAVRSDPLGLLRREQRLTESCNLYVHPETVRMEGSNAGMVRDLEGQSVRKLTDSDVAFHTLRDYVPGDDRRHIHWKTTARTGQLMVRQFEETRRSHLLLLLSTRLDDYATDEEFELAISIVGSLGAQALLEGQTTTVATSTRRLRTWTPRTLLDQLAGVEFERQAPRLVDVARRLGREVPGVSVAVVACGSLVRSGELRRIRRALSIDARAIVTRAEPETQTVVRPMGDLQLARIGALGELPRAVRRMSL